MESQFERDYLDVLQNIEGTIVHVYKDHPELTDYQVDSALEALLRSYHREAIGGTPVPPKAPLAKTVFEAVRLACEWRLGREQVVDEEEQPISLEPLSVEEIEACLKHIRRSLQMWNKELGPQGYLNYIHKFLP